MATRSYTEFCLATILLVFPALELGPKIPIYAGLSMALSVLLLDGLLTTMSLKLGGVEVNPILLILTRRMGVTFGVMVTRVLGVAVCISLAFLGMSSALFLTFMILTLASCISLRTFLLSRALQRAVVHIRIDLLTCRSLK